MDSVNRRISNIEQHLSVNSCSDAVQTSGTLEPVRPFNPDKLFEYLFPHHLEMRRQLIAEFEAPENELMQRAPFGLSYTQERDLTMEQTKRLIEIAKRYVKVIDFVRDPTKIAAWTQSYRMRNIATTTLFGVHFSLFGATILQLGTDEQREKYLKHVEDFSMPGCFALTELGHGSNVQQIETLAVYDHSTEEFIINSPTITSQKYFIGGAAKNARWTVAFAQLKVGEKYEGVHAFLMRIRNEDGSVCNGVKIADCGVKMALNGVDNGRLMFTNYRVPRDQLLSRFGGVNKAGIYSSPINPAIKRFAHNIGALVIGRYIISIGCISFSAVGLQTAINYAFTRRQFGEDNNERQLITYAVHQRRLLPHLAFNYGIHFANDYLLRLLAEKENRKDKEIHVYASALKAYSSWHNRNCLQDCREACGGQGFLADNLIGPFKSETDIYTTFEGDNVLMYQQVAKYILTEARRKPPPEYNPPSDAFRAKTDSKHLRSFDFLLQAMTARLNQYVVLVANKLMEAVGSGKPVMDAWNDCGSYILNLGIVFTDKFILERFIEGVSKCPDDNQRKAMSLLLSLMGLFIINRDTWFIKYQFISVDQSDAIENEISDLCKEIAPISIALAEGFGFSTKTMGPIGRDWIAENRY
ncbi:acyl-CoA oxidase [Heterostelium album PN500]|uniref:Acyl-coenzyme A oxidase n=1 Tax=Heterostelium pallidum (strain ATCC 26659 / Pp 5 / PN500) TaxID=670386 RepID=D3BUR8_HETP5|nr:acyl-CoA oxidase [Heterostelium album PN500]EFA74856.1 acyl-CoA oxidase [Heterostelium album PN500]|eukprot:XP_020426990.1 acyl-CoA oxidase [Heterostelium album PN500]